MKESRSQIPLFTLAAILLCCSGVFALEYTVTFYNKTASAANVTLYIKPAAGNATAYNASPLPISAGSQSSISVLAFPGGSCPSYVAGTVGSSTIVQMSCDGIEGTSQGYCCGSPSFNIIKKSNVYHFEKK